MKLKKKMNYWKVKLKKDKKKTSQPISTCQPRDRGHEIKTTL
jgi:hypothetical protein